MDTSGYSLFVLWEKARGVEPRILDDIKQHLEIVCVRACAMPCRALDFYRRFYGPALPDARQKVARCGKGNFVLIVVRDPSARCEKTDVHGVVKTCNPLLVELKDKYRTWAHGGHRVHGTIDDIEFARDIYTLTGHTADAWRQGVPPEPWCFKLPDAWGNVRPEIVPERLDAKAVYFPALTGEKPAADWDQMLGREGTLFGLSDCTRLFGPRTLNDACYKGAFRGRPCLVKCSTKAVRSIRAEFTRALRVFAEAPAVVAEPLAFLMTADATRAFAATAWVEGPSLTRLLEQGLSAAQATAFACDIQALARALKSAQIVHRDLFTDNFILGADGHLKVIDWQMALALKTPVEDPWVARHWKFRYVVFGVNRDLGLGVWNDFRALGKILAKFPQTETVKAVAAELAAQAPEMTYADRPQGRVRFLLWCYGCSLRLQMLLRGRRSRKYAQLARRWRTVRETERA